MVRHLAREQLHNRAKQAEREGGVSFSYDTSRPRPSVPVPRPAMLPGGLPGMRSPDVGSPLPMSAAAKALRVEEASSTFEQRAIWLANASVVLLIAVVLLFTLLGAAPDRPRKKQQVAAAAAAGKRAFTAAEVARHNTAARARRCPSAALLSCPDAPGQADLWIILDGKVYDVTSYVEEHPGGEAILRNAGRDSTKGFHGPQHPGRVFDIIEDFCIGSLDEAAKDK